MAYRLSKLYPSKRAFITGGGGSLGKAFAKHLGKDGWTIGITDISDTALNEAKREVEVAGGSCLTYRFDVSDKIAYKAAFDDFVSKNGGLDLIINNAGVGDGGLLGEYELDKWEWITGINQMAVIYGTHYAAQVMKKQRSGHILTISSLAAVACMPNMSMYNVTKAAVLALSESIYAELKPFGINVSVAMPEFFRSNIMQLAKGDASAVTIGKKKIEKAPFTPEEVADTILVQAGSGTFYILHPAKAKIAFLFRNWFPNLFLSYKLKQFTKKKWVREALKKT
jgi:NAD(P)-dependent dehydrogenase (short-subunit alcohol dehydrogenase family)